MDLVRNPVFALSNTIQFVELMVKLTLIDVNWIVPMWDFRIMVLVRDLVFVLKNTDQFAVLMERLILISA